jgi:hypothetical protein
MIRCFGGLQALLGLIVDRIGNIERKFGYMQDVIEGRHPNIPRAGVGLAPAPIPSATLPPSLRSTVARPPFQWRHELTTTFKTSPPSPRA